MIKKIMLALAVMVPMLVSAQTVKIGYVAPDEIMQSLPEAKTVQTKLAEISKKYEDQLATMQTELNTKMDEYQKMGASEPQSIKERKAKDIEDLQKRIQDFYQTARQDIDRQQQTLIQPLETKLRDAIDAVGKEGSFTVIIEKGMMLYYAAPAVDITPQVKAKLGIK